MQQEPGIGNAFGPVEEDIVTAFLPALFEGVVYGVPGRAITRLPVKQAGMALPYPTQTDPDNWQVSCVITGHLVSALRGQVLFRLADHAACLWDGRAAVQWKSVEKVMASLETTIAGAPRGSHPSIATGDKDWVLPDGAAVKSKWDGAGSAGMARCRLSVLWPRSPRPPQTL